MAVTSPWTEEFINNPPVAGSLEAVQALEVPEECNVKATFRAMEQLSPVGTGAFVTSMVALDNGIPQEVEASVSFFGYFFADQKSNSRASEARVETVLIGKVIPLYPLAFLIAQ